jgi:hypothetical protein
MLLNKLTNQVIEKFYTEIDKDENKAQLQKILIEPLIIYITKRMYSKFVIIILLFLIITFLSIINSVILIKIFFLKKKIDNTNVDFGNVH